MKSLGPVTEIQGTLKGGAVLATASEALAANDLVNVYDNGGTLSAQKASASDATRPADGFVDEGYSGAAMAKVFKQGVIAGSGLTSGAVYYLSTTGGAATAVAPAATGNVVQQIGKAISATQLLVQIQDPVELG